MILEAAIWAGFGLILGSFANVCILRYGTWRGIDGRSSCSSCKKTLLWHELIPVLSFIALRGKCGSCGTRISIQYPIVEVLAGIGFVILGLAPVPFVLQLAGACIVFLFLCIAVYDTYHLRMPDIWVFSFIAIAFLISLWTTFSAGGMWAEYLVVVFGGFAVSVPLFAMWFFSRGAWMGFGDVKFAIGIGFLLGVVDGYFALALSFIIGAFVSVFLLLPAPLLIRGLTQIGITRLGEGGKGFTMKSEVPFGPFLIAGTWIVWTSSLYGFDLFSALFVWI